MAISLITGLPGGGKTLYGTRRILEARAAGRQVLANFHSKQRLWKFALWDEMSNAEDALCVIDEAHMWFGSRAWKEQSVGDLGVFQQHRKNGLDMLIITQDKARVDTVIRELAAWEIKCSKLFGKWIIAKTYVADRPRPVQREVFRIRPGLFNHYFTSEIIGERDGKKYRFGSIGVRTEIVDGQIAPTHYRVSDAYRTCIVEAGRLGDALARSLEATGVHDALPSFTPLILDAGTYYEVGAPVRSYGRGDRIMDSFIGEVAESIKRDLPTAWK